MSKVKYYYDPDTLSYRKIEPKKSKKYRNIGLFILGAFFFGAIALILLLNTNLINTPRELSLSREIKNYELQFELLDKKMEQIEEVLANSEMIITTTKRLDVIKKQMAIQSKSLEEIALLAKEKEKLLLAIPAIQPINNEDLTRMASGYGWRSDPFTKVRKMHYGMDFTSPRGTPIYASGDGKITRADNNSSGYGKHIRIE